MPALSADVRLMRRLDPAAPTPLWRQLKQALRDFATFHLQAGDRIPSEAQLCKHYGLSRVTVRQAITSLVNSGLLLRQHGRGTFVLPGRVPEPLTDADHFLESSFDAAPGGSVRVYSAEVVLADEWVAAKLQAPAGEQLYKVRTVLYQGDEAVAYRVSWVRERSCPGLLAHDLAVPLHRLLERQYGVRLVRADEVIECVASDEFRAQVLRVPLDQPLLVVQWLIYQDAGEPLEFSRSYYRADRFHLQHRLTRARSEPTHRTSARSGVRMGAPAPNGQTHRLRAAQPSGRRG